MHTTNVDVAVVVLVGNQRKERNGNNITTAYLQKKLGEKWASELDESFLEQASKQPKKKSWKPGIMETWKGAKNKKKKNHGSFFSFS